LRDGGNSKKKKKKKGGAVDKLESRKLAEGKKKGERTEIMAGMMEKRQGRRRGNVGAASSGEGGGERVQLLRGEKGGGRGGCAPFFCRRGERK